MLRTRNLLVIFLPALILAFLALFIRVIQYEPLFPKENTEGESAKDQFVVPLFNNDPILGDKKAPLTVIAFEDFGCEACSYQDTLISALLEQYPKKVKFVWKTLPVTKFPYPTDRAARYGFCADEQNQFEEFKRFAFANEDNLSEAGLEQIAEAMKLDKNRLTRCLAGADVETHMTKNQQLALLLNVQAVPTFFVDNVQISTPQSIDQWKAVLNL